MEENNIPSIEQSLDTDTPSDADILSALGMDSEESSEGTEIIEESQEVVADSSSDEPETVKTLLDLAKEELENEEKGEDEGAEASDEDEGQEPEAKSEEPKEAQSETEEFEVTIDGEIQSVSLQDLKNDYSGRTAVAQRFTELDKDKKEFYNEKSKVEAYINEFSSKIKDGDAMAAFGYLAEFAGTPSYLLKEQLVAALRPEIERRYTLSDQEQQKELLTAELDHMKAQKESETKRQAAEQSTQELQSSVNSVRETHKITEDTWNQAFAQLDKELPATAEITIESVKLRSLDINADTLSTDILSDYDEVPGDAKTALKQVILENPDFTEADLKDIVEESLKVAQEKKKEAKAKDLGKQLKSKGAKTTTTTSTKSNNKNSQTINGIEIAVTEDWDDIL